MTRPTNKDARYPYTYACDWLVMAGAADHRGEASRLFDGYDEACTLADQYIIYWNLKEDAEDVLRHTKEKLNDVR